MTADPLVEAIRSAPCRRDPKHAECQAAAAREWMAGLLDAEQARWQAEQTDDIDEGARAAIDSLRAALLGPPWDLDAEPGDA